MLTFTLTAQANTEQTDLLIAFEQTDNLPTQLQQLTAQYGLPHSVAKDFKGDLKEVLSVHLPEQKVYLLGLGKKPISKDIILAYRFFFHQQKSKLADKIIVDMRHLPALDVAFAVNGIGLASYHIHLYKTDKIETPHFFQRGAGEVQIWVQETDMNIAQTCLQRGEATAETQREILQLVNLPSNRKLPKTLVDWAVASSQKYGYKATILDKEALQREGLHALLGVNLGSPASPYLIVLEHKPAEGLPKVGLVGKGVTFDTGGVSIKDSNNMHFMKCDMAGGAGVLGAFELAVKLNVQKHLIAVIPTTQNCTDGASMHPSDVIESYVGKTIEIIDTDAEGRVILADGLAYLNRNFQPDYLIDMATLTGSCVATLGYVAGGLFTQNDDLAAKLLQSSERTGERLWRLPMWDDYKGDISSDVADVRNYSGKPIAGAISAAKFLEVFTENHTQFAHIDMAGVCFTDSDFATMRSATAYGVRLLFDFIENL